MSDELRASDSEDLSADTERFRRFAQTDDGGDAVAGSGRAVGVPFRLLTLAAGLVVLAVILWLLLQG